MPHKKSASPVVATVSRSPNQVAPYPTYTTTQSSSPLSSLSARQLSATNGGEQPNGGGAGDDDKKASPRLHPDDDSPKRAMLVATAGKNFYQEARRTVETVETAVVSGAAYMSNPANLVSDLARVVKEGQGPNLRQQLQQPHHHNARVCGAWRGRTS